MAQQDDVDVVDADVSFVDFATDTSAVYNVSNNESSATWEDYYIRNDYIKNGNIYVMGNTAQNPSALSQSSVSFVQLAKPILIWVCDWTVERSQIKPTIPDPASQDPNWVLLDEVLQPEAIDVNADGVSPIYRISGTYYYGHINPDSKTINNINYPRFPWYDSGTFSQTIDPDQLKQGLSDIPRPASGRILRTGGIDQSDGLTDGVIRRVT